MGGRTCPGCRPCSIYSGTSVEQLHWDFHGILDCNGIVRIAKILGVNCVYRCEEARSSVVFLGMDQVWGLDPQYWKDCVFSLLAGGTGGPGWDGWSECNPGAIDAWDGWRAVLVWFVGAVDRKGRMEIFCMFEGLAKTITCLFAKKNLHSYFYLSRHHMLLIAILVQSFDGRAWSPP